MPMIDPLEEKKKRIQELLAKHKAKGAQPKEAETSEITGSYRHYTYDMFMGTMGVEPVEMTRFNSWVKSARAERIYAFESPRLTAQRSEVRLRRENGEELSLLNFSSYNYLGYGYHPEVIAAAKAGLDQYGLGAASSPVISGTLEIHQKLEQGLVSYFDLPGYGVSLFSAGYAVNLGTISAFIKGGGCVILDRSAHISLLEGAQLSRGGIFYFRHNDLDHLEEVLQRVADGKTRVLICTEGTYSADGDFGKIAGIVKLAKRYGAFTLVDEAHSMLLTGSHGRGACDAQGVLKDVDMIVMTFSKSFSGVGGALFAKQEIVQYVNWYAKCRMFSCALDPAVTAGMVKVLELASGPDGDRRRQRLLENSEQMRSLLKGKVDCGVSESWIATVRYGDEKKTLPLNDYLQREGVDTSIMQFPAVPKNESRIRIFLTSEHTSSQIEKAAAIILKAAGRFDFLKA
jgi:7-keto-8-aminopelargonate synthetase-like enzyme